MRLRKTSIFLFAFWLIPIFGICQGVAALQIETKEIEITSLSFYEDRSNLKSPEELNLNLFRTDTQNISSIISKVPFKLWLMLDVKSTLTDSNFVLISNALEKTTLFTQNNASSWNAEKGGFYERWNKEAFIFNLKNNFTASKRIFILVENNSFYLSTLYVGIMTPQSFKIKKADFNEKTYAYSVWYIFLSSVILLISLYAFFQFFLNGNRAYLLYGLFAMCCFFGIVQLFIEFQLSYYLYNFVVSHGRYGSRLFFMVGHLLQSVFFIVFFNLKPDNFKYYPFFKYYCVVQIICVAAFAMGIFLFFPNTYLDVVRDIHNLLLTLGGFISLIFLSLERKGKILNIIIFGTMSLVVSSTFVFLFLPINQFPYPNAQIIFTVATFIELICFWISLAVRDQETERNMLRFKTAALSNEIKALRSQMNPHFIFNCLNSLNLYILENHIDDASDYLQRFSKLIRLVLENSRLERIPLKNELESLQLYMNLESMRFKEKLKFYIDVDPMIDQEMVSVPPLLLQPFIENSIWHGLMHKLEGGSIYLKISQPNENNIQAEIIDDGIGRVAASEMKSKSAVLKKSFGMKVTNERIAAINEIYNTKASASIFDLYDANKTSNGTKVIIKIPI